MRSTSIVSIRVVTLATIAAALGSMIGGNAVLAGDPPPAGTVIATIAADTSNGELAFGDGALWLADAGDTLQRIDPSSNLVVATIPVGCCIFHGVAYGDGSVWVSNFVDNTIDRIDPVTNTVTAVIPTVGLAPEGIAVTPDAVWVADHHGNPTGAVDRIDPVTNTVVASIPVGAHRFCCGPQGIVAAAGAIWVGVPNQFGVARIDPTTNTLVTLIQTGTASPQAQDQSSCGALASAGGAVWSADGGCNPSHLWRIDPSTNAVAGFVTPGSIPSSLASGFGSLWVTVRNGLARVDPVTGANVGWLSLAKNTATDVAVGAGSVWLTTPKGVLRIQPS